MHYTKSDECGTIKQDTKIYEGQSVISVHDTQNSH